MTLRGQNPRSLFDESLVLHGYTSCFAPTSHLLLADTLFSSNGALDPVQFYDLARFVEDFVLADIVLVPHSFYYILAGELEDHDSSCRRYLGSIDDELHRVSLFNDLHMLVADLSDKPPRILADEDFQLLREKIDAGITFHEALQAVGRSAEPALFELDQYNRLRELIYTYADSVRSSNTELHEQVISSLASGTEQRSIDVSPLLAARGVSLSPGVGLIRLFEGTDHVLVRELYDAVAKQFKIKVQRMYRALRLHAVYIPPLLTILFSRMRSTADFPRALIGLRREFSDLRQELGRYEKELRSAKTLKERIDLIEEMEHAQEALSKKIAGRTQKTLLSRTWNVVKGVSPLKIGANALDALYEFDLERVALTRIRRYVDLYSLALRTKDYENQIRRLFGDRVRNWDRLPTLAAAVESSIAGQS